MDDQCPVDMLKAAIPKFGEVYQGAKLVAEDWNDVASRPMHGSLRQCRNRTTSSRCSTGATPALPRMTASSGLNISRAIMILNKESIGPIEAARGELWHQCNASPNLEIYTHRPDQVLSKIHSCGFLIWKSIDPR